MKAKGKAPKVLIPARNSGRRLLTFPRGDTSQEVRYKARKGVYLEQVRNGFCVGSKRTSIDAVHREAGQAFA